MQILSISSTSRVESQGQSVLSNLSKVLRRWRAAYLQQWLQRLLWIALWQLLQNFDRSKSLFTSRDSEWFALTQVPTEREQFQHNLQPRLTVWIVFSMNLVATVKSFVSSNGSIVAQIILRLSRRCVSSYLPALGDSDLSTELHRKRGAFRQRSWQKLWWIT